jgi:AcrR family transcriptional regulator
MDQGPQTRARILDAAERLLRRHGPAKTTVVDVARALGMSHSNVYKHFPSKDALRTAVAERWLSGISGPLEQISAAKGPASRRLRAWFHALYQAKRRKVHVDPELFATYHSLVEGVPSVEDKHVEALTSQLARIVADGMRRGEFQAGNSRRTARALLDATTRFHHPHLVKARLATGRELERVLALVLGGLNPAGKARPRAGRTGRRD